MKQKRKASKEKKSTV